MATHLTDEESNALAQEAELLAERAASETRAADLSIGSLAIAEEWVRVYAKNNGVRTQVRNLAIEYLGVMQREGWGVSGNGDDG